MTRPDWVDQAACRRPGVDPTWFFPDTGRGGGTALAIRRAKTICAGCPVRARCYTDAIARKERWGVWGGHYFAGHHRRRAAA